MVDWGFLCVLAVFLTATFFTYAFGVFLVVEFLNGLLGGRFQPPAIAAPTFQKSMLIALATTVQLVGFSYAAWWIAARVPYLSESLPAITAVAWFLLIVAYVLLTTAWFKLLLPTTVKRGFALAWSYIVFQLVYLFTMFCVILPMVMPAVQ